MMKTIPPSLRHLLIAAAWVAAPAVQAQSSLRSVPVALPPVDEKAVRTHVTQFQAFTLDTEGLNAAVVAKATSPTVVGLTVGSDTPWQLTLEPNEMRTAQYRATVVTSEGTQTLPFAPCQTYKGFADGNPAQTVRLLISDKTVQGFIKRKDDVWCIEPLATFTRHSAERTFILFRQADIIPTAGLRCGVTEAAEQKYQQLNPATNSAPQQRSITSCADRTLLIATDADHEYYGLYGANANQQILSVLNQVEGVYQSTFQLGFRVTSQNVWSIAGDPYSGNDPYVTLNELKDYWNANGGIGQYSRRDLMHLFTGKDYQGVVGVAEIGVVCNSPARSYSLSVDRLGVHLTTAHEIGHNFSAQHTDGINCGSISASIMCQGLKSLYFSSAEISRINGYLNSVTCLKPTLVSTLEVPGLYCSTGGEEFVINHFPKGATGPNWTSSNPSILVIDPITGEFLRGQDEGFVTVTGTFTSPSCGTSSLSQEVYVGDLNSAIDGGDVFTDFDVERFCAEGTVRYYVEWLDHAPEGVYPTWNVTGQAIISRTESVVYAGQVRKYYIDVQPYVLSGNPPYSTYTVNLTLGSLSSCNASFSKPIVFDTHRLQAECSWLRSYTYSVYPNPTSSELVVEAVAPQPLNASAARTSLLSTAGNVNAPTFAAKLYNDKGMLVKTGESANGRISFNTSNLPEGLYTIRTGSGENVVSKRVQVLH